MTYWSSECRKSMHEDGHRYLCLMPCRSCVTKAYHARQTHNPFSLYRLIYKPLYAATEEEILAAPRRRDASLVRSGHTRRGWVPDWFYDWLAPRVNRVPEGFQGGGRDHMKEEGNDR